MGALGHVIAQAAGIFLSHIRVLRPTNMYTWGRLCCSDGPTFPSFHMGARAMGGGDIRFFIFLWSHARRLSGSGAGSLQFAGQAGLRGLGLGSLSRGRGGARSGSLGSSRFVVGCRFFSFLLKFYLQRPIFFRFSRSKSGFTRLIWSMTYQKSGQKQSLL
jgi:hypothetical protein